LVDGQTHYYKPDNYSDKPVDVGPPLIEFGHPVAVWNIQYGLVVGIFGSFWCKHVFTSPIPTIVMGAIGGVMIIGGTVHYWFNQNNSSETHHETSRMTHIC
jgi:hypothetical protein